MILNKISGGDCTWAKKAYHVEMMGGSAMLLVTSGEDFEEENNYDDLIGKVEDIPTAIIKKSTGDVIKNYIKDKKSSYDKNLIHMVMKFKSVCFRLYI